MKLLTAAAGGDHDDFMHAVPGELVYLGVVCGLDEFGDGSCGCGRAFTGFASGKGTTRAVVADVELDREDLLAMLRDRFTAGGWSDVDELATDYADELIEEGEAWPLGTRLRRAIDEVVAE